MDSSAESAPIYHKRQNSKLDNLFVLFSYNLSGHMLVSYGITGHPYILEKQTIFPFF